MAALQIARQPLDALTRDTRTMSRLVDGLEALANRAEWSAADDRRYAGLHLELTEILRTLSAGGVDPGGPLGPRPGQRVGAVTTRNRQGKAVSLHGYAGVRQVGGRRERQRCSRLF